MNEVFDHPCVENLLERIDVMEQHVREMEAELIEAPDVEIDQVRQRRDRPKKAAVGFCSCGEHTLGGDTADEREIVGYKI